MDVKHIEITSCQDCQYRSGGGHQEPIYCGLDINVGGNSFLSNSDLLTVHKDCPLRTSVIQISLAKNILEG